MTYLHNSHDFYTGNALANLENDVKAIADIRSRLGLHETIKNLTGVPVLAILTSATDAGFTQAYEGQIYLSDKTAEVEQKISAAVSAMPMKPAVIARSCQQERKRFSYA